MEQQAENTHGEGGDNDKPFWKQYRVFHAAWAQFCYTGAQGTQNISIPVYFGAHKLLLLLVAIAGYFINYVTEVRPNTDSALGAKFLAAAQGCFAVGRFSGTGV